MSDLKKVGAQIVVEGADQAQKSWDSNVKAAEGYAAVLQKLVPLQADQAIGVIKQVESLQAQARAIEELGTLWETLLNERASKESEAVVKSAQLAQQYQQFWKEAIEGTREEYESFWVNSGQKEQEALIKSSQASQEYISFWNKALQERENAEQEALIKSAQAANEYVRFWQESLNALDAEFEKQMSDDMASGRMKFGIFPTKEDISAFESNAKAAILGIQGYIKEINKESGVIPGVPSLQDFNELAKEAASGSIPALEQLRKIEQELRIEAEKIAFAKYEEAKSFGASSDAATESATKEEIAFRKRTEANERWIDSLKEAQGYQVNQQKQTEEEIAALNNRTKLIVESGTSFGASAKEMSGALQGIGLSAKEAKEILVQYGVDVSDLEKKHSRLSESAIGSSRTFFALTLASFGVMSVAQELKKSFGDDLPPAFEKTSSAIQQIASFGSAGAFVGGAPGAIFGGIAGGLIAITTAAVTLDPELQRLNQQLDNMSNRDETVETLSRIAGVSEEVARVWVEAARKDSDFASRLEEIVKKGEPVPGLLASINETIRGMNGNVDSLGKSFGDLGNTINQTITLGLGLFNAWGAAFEEFSKSGNFLDAQAAGVKRLEEFLLNTTKATTGLGVAQGDAARLTAEAESILDKESNTADKLADAQRRLADATEDANHRMAQLSERTANQYAQAQQQYSNAVQDAAEQRANAIFNAEQTLTNRISDLWQDLQNKVADINQNLADKISDIQVQLQNRIADIQSQLSDRIADIQQQLADKISDINQDLQNKLQDLAHSRDQAVQGANQKILEASRELSRKLYEIERDRLEAIEALAFSTHEQLQDARTDHDRDRILRRAQFEQGQIDQKANDARKDAIADYQDKVAQAEREKKLAKDTYDYQVMLAKQLAAQKIANAQHDADVQIAQAQRQAQQQLAIAQRQAQQQLDIAQREAAQQLALAQRRHEQELATAQRAYQQQVEAARRAEQQRVADAQRALEQRNAAIAQSHDAERKQIEYTLQKAIEAYQRQIAEIKNLVGAVRLLIEQYMVLAGVAENIAKIGSAATTGLFDDWINNIQNVVKKGTQPTAPIIPILGSGERNIITPASISSSTRNNSINIIINDATDARKVGEVVRRELAQVAWR